MIEVVAFLPVEVGVCKACDLARNVGIKATVSLEGNELSQLLEILAKLGERSVRFTNPMSLRGLYLMLKYRTGKLPLVIYNGKLIHSGPINATDRDKILEILGTETD
ncbi:MAG: hypothetical protein OWQ51_03775 [Pyrobaculum arsenaticum]|uniref:Glutaredoxin n=2 Tax=Pyrobaculum arsenaticum TaxID=121277 RepID=A4WMU7_PYRAR|nr:hypothetical protein [Pyrobaculum arsenaticum]ABP51714.1 conserved hypothetical protein [Pyrobaculum arsenaticum DSM 13514]MCY0890092.1 hypothetical protein [Pyrobaculum arsenaticum]NYR16035.1 hypothetical protein [Pyrobaculum arsenaticum]